MLLHASTHLQFAANLPFLIFFLCCCGVMESNCWSARTVFDDVEIWAACYRGPASVLSQRDWE